MSEQNVIDTTASNQTLATLETSKEYTLACSQASWSKLLKLKAEASSLEREIKALEQNFNWPTPESLASTFRVPQGESKTVMVVNGNGDYIGKYTFYYHGGAVIPAGWRKRIS